jgi:exodeoxyribonuclease VII small subunit
MAANEKKETPGFETSLARLEAIVKEMEGGQLSLEKMIERFEEGMGLVKLCTGKLNEVEKKIEQLVQKGGEVSLEPFAEEASPEPPKPAPRPPPRPA